VRRSARILVRSTICNLLEVADQTAETLVRIEAVSGRIPTENFPLNRLAFGIETRWGLLQDTGSELLTLAGQLHSGSKTKSLPVTLADPLRNVNSRYGGKYRNTVNCQNMKEKPCIKILSPTHALFLHNSV
jgi:hypothetical protein